MTKIERLFTKDVEINKIEWMENGFKVFYTHRQVIGMKFNPYGGWLYMAYDPETRRKQDYINLVKTMKELVSIADRSNAISIGRDHRDRIGVSVYGI